MIIAILKSIGIALLVAAGFALLAFGLLVLISAIAMAEYHKQNGDMYDFDDKHEQNRIKPIGWEKLINDNKNNDSDND